MEVGTYTKFQLAHAYGMGQKMFARKLATIQAELEQKGYKKKQKVLTPALVEIVFNRLGRPM